MKNLKFNLTTTDGRKKAMEAFDKYGWIPLPGIWAAKKLFDFITKSDVSTIEAQKKAAVDLIKTGKKNGVGSMTITLDQTAGLDVGADVEGIPIKCKIGKSGHMIIDVHYKNS